MKKQLKLIVFTLIFSLIVNMVSPVSVHALTNYEEFITNDNVQLHEIYSNNSLKDWDYRCDMNNDFTIDDTDINLLMDHMDESEESPNWNSKFN